MFDLFEKWDGTPRQGEGASSSGSEVTYGASSSSSGSSSSDSSSSQSDPYSSLFSQNSPQSYSSQKTFVLSVGGSVFFNEKLRAPEIAKFCEVINELKREGYNFVLIVGGGRVARAYQAGVKALGGNNFEMDEAGIAITRANAFLFTHGIDKAWKTVLSDPKDADNILRLERTPVYGGSIPGQTTDAVAAIIAELVGGDMINLSNVDGIFSADPAKEPNAKMYTELTHTKMISLLKAQASKPGAHTFIDPHAANMLWRSRIKGFFINGNDFENFKAVVRGQSFRGTVVKTEPAGNEVQLDE